MGLLLAFAPFMVFVLVERLAGPRMGLIAAALISGTLLLRDWVSRNRGVKVLEVGTFLLFGGLAAYAAASGAAWSVVGVRLYVDTGLLLVVLVSIAIRRPFTLPYAREGTPRESWNAPAFIRTNYIITAVWGLAFTVMVGADLVMLYLPNLPLKVGVGATILAVIGAMRFTSWYTDHVRALSDRATLGRS
jgi:hypothetical protein